MTRLFLIQKIMLPSTDLMITKTAISRVDQRTTVPTIPTIITAGMTARDLLQVRGHQMTDSSLMVVQRRTVKSVPEPAMMQVIMKIIPAIIIPSQINRQT